MTDQNNTPETVEVVKVIELNEIFVGDDIFFPKFKGGRVKRDVKVGDKKNKLTFNLPIPKTDEEAGELYNLTLANIIERGVKQLSYGADSAINKDLKDKMEAGFDFTTLADTTPFATMFMDGLFITERVAKTGAVKVAKKKASTLDAIGASLGLSPEEMANMGAADLVALIKKSKDKK